MIKKHSDYISLFTGIGGLEGTNPPIGYSEIDQTCIEILKNKYYKTKNLGDVKKAEIIKCDVIVGGWPCQDISIAGKGKGLRGENSKMFYDMVNYANNASAHTIIAENVPNLLRLDSGSVFREVINEFVKLDFKYISWRSINSRQFGLPHNRNRIFIVASKDPKIPMSLFRKINAKISNKKSSIGAFYWTAGTHSINYNIGYVPTLKLGGDFLTPSSIALFFETKIRVLSGIESIKLQGFDPKPFKNISNGKLVNLAGNAVSKPVGKFVVDGVLNSIIDENNFKFKEIQRDFFENNLEETSFSRSGFFDGEIHHVSIRETEDKASNLDDFLDLDNENIISQRAASGLLRRLDKSSTYCPEILRNKLEEYV